MSGRRRRTSRSLAQLSPEMQMQAEAARSAAKKLQGSGLSVADPKFQEVKQQEWKRLHDQQQKQQGSARRRRSRHNSYSQQPGASSSAAAAATY